MGREGSELCHALPEVEVFVSLLLHTIGNVLIDALMLRWYGAEFDQDGRMVSCTHPPFTSNCDVRIFLLQALIGKVSTELLDNLLKDEFLATAPPKSTGREVAVQLSFVQDS